MKLVVTGCARAVRGEHGPLGAVAGEQLVGAEPGEVELLGRVGEGGGGARRLDLVPARVVLAPDRPAPGLVQPAELAVARPEPAPEGLRRPLAVAGGHVAAVLVADVPHGDGRVLRVALAPSARPGRRRRRGRPGRSGSSAGARRGASRRPSAVTGRISGWAATSQGGGDAVAVARSTRMPALGQQVQDPVQPARGQLARRGLQPGPGEDPDGHQVDARLGHQPDVLGPGGLGPLLGVVVAAVARCRRAPRHDPPACVRLRAAHSWTLPAARPDRQKRCSERNAMTSGITEISEPMTT